MSALRPYPDDESPGYMTDLRQAREAMGKMAIKEFLADPSTKERVSIAVQAVLQAITDRNNLRKTVRVGQAAEVIAVVVMDALNPIAADIELATSPIAGSS